MGVVYFQNKGWQAVVCIHLQACNPKYYSWDKIEDFICGESVGCMVRDREEKPEKDNEKAKDLGKQWAIVMGYCNYHAMANWQGDHWETVVSTCMEAELFQIEGS